MSFPKKLKRLIRAIWESKATSNNGMHPTADTPALKLLQSLGAAGDAWRYAARLFRKGEGNRMKRLTTWATVAPLTFLLGIALEALWLGSSQQPPSPSRSPEAAVLECPPSPLPDILHDFQFVGGGILSPEVPSHGVKPLPFPDELEAGRQYVFHHARTDRGSRFQELQERLRAKGVSVLKAREGISPYVGSPLFVIAFNDGRYRGRISNTLDGRIVRSEDLGRRLSFEDYVLVIEEARCSR
jgi:hypothetical protein